MYTFELAAGEGVQIGNCTLQVLEVRPGEVVLTLFDPSKDCAYCGDRPAARRRCPICQNETLVCRGCLPSRNCPRCASAW
jgi:hypothetical protein